MILGQTYVTSYTYDLNGNQLTLTYPSTGHVAAYSYDALSRVTQVTFDQGSGPQVITQSRTYDPRSLMTGEALGNGLVHTRNYDQLGRITSIDVTGGIMSWSYGYSPISNITSIADILDPSKSKTYAYDSLSRLTDATGPWGGPLGWTYDKVGNRLTYSAPEGLSTYSYQPGTNRLTSVSGTDPKTFTYDPSGNTISENTRTYTYNLRNRMIRGEDGGVLGQYSYNAKELRASKAAESSATVFHYSRGGTIIGETNEAGAVLAEYLWDGSQPLAKTELGAVSFIHTDHIATPQAMTDPLGGQVWRVDSRPFGDAPVASGSAALNLRFPGQYYDAETNLHQNWYRWYESHTGRYTSPDPLGRRGRPHPYLYALGDPVRRSDPRGLDTVGCDSIDDEDETPCKLKCCAIHDKCYDDFNCYALSWVSDTGCNPQMCDVCNAAVQGCWAICRSNPQTIPDIPEYYCAKQHRFVEIPGDFPNRAAAEKKCEYDHACDCAKDSGPPAPPPPCKGFGCVDSR